VIEAFKIEGLLAIEYIIDSENNCYINEVSPRPHNTGHHTIEFNSVSQFEQHWRAILDLPLEKNKNRAFSYCINVLGPNDGTGEPKYLGLNELYSERDIHVHIYGKDISKPKRKLGHITIVADSEQELQDKLKIVENNFKVEV
jgi:5-(carboxyamino)imidazole ribonucleotide synthase